MTAPLQVSSFAGIEEEWEWSEHYDERSGNMIGSTEARKPRKAVVPRGTTAVVVCTTMKCVKGKVETGVKPVKSKIMQPSWQHLFNLFFWSFQCEKGFNQQIKGYTGIPGFHFCNS